MPRVSSTAASCSKAPSSDGSGCILRAVKTSRRAALAVVALALVSLVAGCAGMNMVEHRTTQGPSAREMWTIRIMAQNGREPTFDERQAWQDQLDLNISR